VRVRLIAKGSVDHGNIVVLNNDGTVSKGETSYNWSVGNTSTFESSEARSTSSLFIPDKDRIVVFYSDWDNQRNGYYKICNISNNSTSFSGKVLLLETYMSYISTYYSLNSKKIIIAYKDNGHLGYGKVIVGEFNGDVLMFGDPVTFSEDEQVGIDVCGDGADKILVTYRRNGMTVSAKVGTINDLSVSFGDRNDFTPSSASAFKTLYNKVHDKFVICIQNDSNSNGECILGTVTENSVSFMPPVLFAASIHNLCVGTDVSGKLMIAYSDKSDSYRGKLLIGTIAGDLVSFNSQVLFHNGSCSYFNLNYNPIDNIFMLVYFPSTSSSGCKPRAMMCKIVNNSVEIGNVIEINDLQSTLLGSVYDYLNNRGLVFYSLPLSSYAGKATVVNPNVESNISDWVGVSNGSYLNAEEVEIFNVNDILENQNNLIAGETYYISESAELINFPTTYGVVGEAVDETSLRITNVNI